MNKDWYNVHALSALSACVRCRYLANAVRGVQALIADVQLACRLADVAAGFSFRHRLALVSLAVLVLASHLLLIVPLNIL